MRARIFSSQPEPSRQGVHWPQDSLWKNRVSRQAARTMHVVSSMATIEPDPSMVPFLPTSSWSRGMSRCWGPNQYDEAPPGMKALSSRSPRMPPAYTGA